jgi:hypothetical protein
VEKIEEGLKIKKENERKCAPKSEKKKTKLGKVLTLEKIRKLRKTKENSEKKPEKREKPEEKSKKKKENLENMLPVIDRGCDTPKKKLIFLEKIPIDTPEKENRNLNGRKILEKTDKNKSELKKIEGKFSLKSREKTAETERKFKNALENSRKCEVQVPGRDNCGETDCNLGRGPAAVKPRGRGREIQVETCITNTGKGGREFLKKTSGKKMNIPPKNSNLEAKKKFLESMNLRGGVRQLTGQFEQINNRELKLFVQAPAASNRRAGDKPKPPETVDWSGEEKPRVSQPMGEDDINLRRHGKLGQASS